MDNPPQRWVLRLAIEDDLRFLSHRETLTAVERAGARADLPLRYSRGYNPRPALSLLCPRPVGVATADDVLVLGLDGPVEGGELLRRLNRQAPRGMCFCRAERLAGRQKLRLRRVRYELRLPAERLEDARRRVQLFVDAPAWPVEPAAGRTGSVDLRRLIAEIAVTGETLHWVSAGEDGLRARPRDVMEQLGLDGRSDLARVVRTEVHCGTSQ